MVGAARSCFMAPVFHNIYVRVVERGFTSKNNAILNTLPARRCYRVDLENSRA